ncbi:NADP-dependent oxidoreductase [Streptomyces sp. CB01881]|uniref:NADP-dependent oxidoreductase n=1 Tax=Streptomyces sp. CB01881 TaxID=2078691 RepID=UPI000CDC2985|nr:NADP-dependent oxidoreductase [Streptomyces sp. CB01881]AUY48809.1 NADPH:quinone reductase [Streptomyces sp. CB01881]TYC77298.1 NADP-dependent oxidoreductase [Streptomyces sp. CB01881]
MAKAFGFVEYGGPENQEFLDRPVLEPGPGQLGITVRVAGVNPVDWKVRRGWLGKDRELPAVMGQEAAGVVERIGPGVTGFTPGDEVFGVAAAGAFAEQTLLLASMSAVKPGAVGFAEAATLPVAAATADDGVRDVGVGSGQTLLILGIAGGVGSVAAQIARSRGIRVVGTAGDANRGYVESLGAVQVRYGDGVAERIRAVAPDGVDGILDLVGGDDLRAAAATLSDRSKLVSTVDPATAAELGGRFITRSTTPATLAGLAALVAAGELDVHITGRHPLAHAAEALALVESGHAHGKLILEIG